LNIKERKILRKENFKMFKKGRKKGFKKGKRKKEKFYKKFFEEGKWFINW